MMLKTRMKTNLFWVGLVIVAIGISFGNVYATPQTPNGKSIYERKCSRCHGDDGTPEKRNVPSLKKSDMTDAERIGIITNGEEKMPAFGKKLSKEEIQTVAAYTKSFKR
jgi:cytochrome c6